MMKRALGTWTLTFLLLWGTMAALLPHAALASPHFGRVMVADFSVAIISREQAAVIAQNYAGGRVLSVELEKKGHPCYRVKVLVKDRLLRTVMVDAETGRVRK